MTKKRSFFGRMTHGVKTFTGNILGMRMLKPSTLYICDIMSTMIHSFKKEEVAQSFEEAIQQYQLTEEALAQKKKKLLINCLLYLSFGLALFFYGCLNISSLSFMVFVNYLLAASVMFVFAFRMHYYRFLIIKKRLDLRYRDWFSAVINGDL